MYAIIEAKGFQFRVSPDDIIKIPYTEGKEGDKIRFDKVLLYHDGKKHVVGTPYIPGMYVEAEIVRHGREKKILVFRYIRRENMRRLKGHRQPFTEVKILKIAKEE